jgi:hypothetical protein
VGDGVKKRYMEKKLEDDVYNMETSDLESPSAAPADKTGGMEKAPTKDNVVGSPKKSKKATGKVDIVARSMRHPAR